MSPVRRAGIYLVLRPSRWRVLKDSRSSAILSKSGRSGLTGMPEFTRSLESKTGPLLRATTHIIFRSDTAATGPWTGGQGTWVIPDWVAVSQDWDGVHVSLGGYLEAAYRAANAGGGFTLLAGWNPDETLWLNDVVSSTDLLGDIGPGQHWAIMPDRDN